MIPLWTRAILPVPSEWGCAFMVDGFPCVAHRVCPIPMCPPRSGVIDIRSPTLPSVLDVRISSFPSFKIAIPAESYPRYSSFFKRSNRTGMAPDVPRYPTIPHISHHQRMGRYLLPDDRTSLDPALCSDNCASHSRDVASDPVIIAEYDAEFVYRV